MRMKTVRILKTVNNDDYVLMKRNIETMDNLIQVTLSNGDTIEAELVTENMIGINASKLSDVSEIIELAEDDAFISFSTDSITSTNNRLLGISATMQEDGSFYYMLTFEKQPDDAAELRRQIAELLAENQELKDYADAGKVMFGEDVE